jgi:hypothetical protein
LSSIPAIFTSLIYLVELNLDNNTLETLSGIDPTNYAAASEVTEGSKNSMTAMNFHDELLNARNGEIASKIIIADYFYRPENPHEAYEDLVKWIIWTGSLCVVEANATSGASVRGKSYNIVLLDEFAHIEPNLAEKFWTSTFPVLSSGTTSKCIIVSTPNGINLFYELWEKAKMAPPAKIVQTLPKKNRAEYLRSIDPNFVLSDKWNKFVPVEVHYTEVPGREKAEWAQEQIAIMGQDRFDQEFGSFSRNESIYIYDTLTCQEIKIPIGDLYARLCEPELLDSR